MNPEPDHPHDVRILKDGSEKNDTGAEALGEDSFRHVETGLAGELGVENRHVRWIGQDRGQRVVAVRRAAGDRVAASGLEK